MKQIDKNNIDDFMKYYHDFHDSYITNINYDVFKSLITMTINVYWSGEPKLKEDKTYETNKTKIKMNFVGVEKCNNKEIFSWDYIYEAYLDYIKIKNKEFICFASDKEEPFVYICCDKIEYEELERNED